MTTVTRDELDRHMEALRMYLDGIALDTIEAHFHVDHRTLRRWLQPFRITATQRQQRRAAALERRAERALEARAATLPEGMMLCAECEVVCETHESGLCPDCRKEDVERNNNELQARLEFERSWDSRNMVRVG